MHMQAVACLMCPLPLMILPVWPVLTWIREVLGIVVGLCLWRLIWNTSQCRMIASVLRGLHQPPSVEPDPSSQITLRQGVLQRM